MPDLDESLRMLPALHAASIPGVTELVPAVRTILVHFDPSIVTADALRTRLLSIEPSDQLEERQDSVEIAVHYGGEDLVTVAELLAVSEQELIERHQAATWRVAFSGFAPGFGYLICEDPLFDVPRRNSPRTRIPAGSVALAGRFSGVYPRESPGGWQLIGRTDAAMWDLERDPPALLSPGTTVRFSATNREIVPGARSAPRPVDSRCALEVVRPGLQLLVQDLGRPGMAAQGVASAGAADREALREANRAVGNEPNTAGLEIAGGGASLRFRGPTVASLSGALATATLTGTAVDFDRPFAVEDGDELRIGGVAEGMRIVLAIRGGLAIDPVLDSCSTDTLAGLGPDPLQTGDVVPLHGPHSARHPVERTRAPRRALPKSGEVTELRIVLGPRDDWFTDSALHSLCSQEWQVTPRSDRIGLRLSGDALQRARDGELDSEGAVTGAIQVPADGQPVLFLADHPLTGGYPIIGSVIDDDLDLAGQLPPGARVRFRVEATDDGKQGRQ